jgi:hypothetical protein
MESTTVKRSKAARAVRKVLRTFIIVSLLVLAGFIYWRYYFTYSSGNRYGLLQKFSHKGNIFKTYEGEMILSSVKGNNNIPIASEKFFFSVADEDVAKKIMSMQGRYVTVHYKEKKGALSWRGDTPYIVDSVQLDQ